MIRVAKIVKTCGACPAQWEGITDDNRQIYVRYRWGCLNITIGAADDMLDGAAVRGESIYACEHGDQYDGSIGYAELKKLSKSAVQFPAAEYDAVDWVECSECHAIGGHLTGCGIYKEMYG